MLVRTPVGIRPGMTFHIQVPRPRRVGDRVEALRRLGRYDAGRFHSARIASVLDGGAHFTVDWDDGILFGRRVAAAGVRDHPSAEEGDQAMGRFEVVCPPGCMHPSSFVAQIPDPAAQSLSPAQQDQQRSTEPLPPPRRVQQSVTPARGGERAAPDYHAPRRAGGGIAEGAPPVVSRADIRAALFTATSREPSSPEPDYSQFAIHQEALQKVINDVIRPSGRERARIAALQQYHQQGRRCLHNKAWSRAKPAGTFAARGSEDTHVPICTCQELCHLTLRREFIVEDTYMQLRDAPQSLHRQLIVKYEGEDGIDEGGLSKPSCKTFRQDFNCE